MAKKCMLERENKRKSLVTKYSKRRELILKELKTADSLESIFELNEKIPIPIANGDGRYFVDDETLKQLERKNQIVFKYDQVVNGSSNQIAGVCNEDGNVVGMMPHPERAAEPEINPHDNKPSSLIFESLLKKIGANN